MLGMKYIIKAFVFAIVGTKICTTQHSGSNQCNINDRKGGPGVITTTELFNFRLGTLKVC